MFKKFLVKKVSNQIIRMLKKLYPEVDFEMENRQIRELILTATTRQELTMDEIHDIEDGTHYTFEKEIKEDDYYKYIFIDREIKEY